jgi:hypothetical protein
MEVVVIALELEVGYDLLRVLVRPVREHHHVVALEPLPVAVPRLDHDRAVEAGLLLECRVAVIPIRAGLTGGQRNAIGEGLARHDAAEAQTRYPVHAGRRTDAVPMDRGRHGERVPDQQRHRVALAPAQHGARQQAVHQRRRRPALGDVDRCPADREVEDAAAQLGMAEGGQRRATWLVECRYSARRKGARDEPATRDDDSHAPESFLSGSCPGRRRAASPALSSPIG